MHHCGFITLTVAGTDDIGCYGIVWRCSYCKETDNNTDSHWVLYTSYRSRSRSRPLLVWLKPLMCTALTFRIRMEKANVNRVPQKMMKTPWSFQWQIYTSWRTGYSLNRGLYPTSGRNLWGNVWWPQLDWHRKASFFPFIFTPEREKKNSCEFEAWQFLLVLRKDVSYIEWNHIQYRNFKHFELKKWKCPLNISLILLPPASEGWRKVLFSQVFVLSSGEGLPWLGPGRGIPHPNPPW